MKWSDNDGGNTYLVYFLWSSSSPTQGCEVIVVLCSHFSPPFSYSQSLSEPSDFILADLTLLCSELGKRCEWFWVSWTTPFMTAFNKKLPSHLVPQFFPREMISWIKPIFKILLFQLYRSIINKKCKVFKLLWLDICIYYERIPHL